MNAWKSYITELQYNSPARNLQRRCCWLLLFHKLATEEFLATRWLTSHSSKEQDINLSVRKASFFRIFVRDLCRRLPARSTSSRGAASLALHAMYYVSTRCTVLIHRYTHSVTKTKSLVAKSKAIEHGSTITIIYHHDGERQSGSCFQRGERS